VTDLDSFAEWVGEQSGLVGNQKDDFVAALKKTLPADASATPAGDTVNYDTEPTGTPPVAEKAVLIGRKDLEDAIDNALALAGVVNTSALETNVTIGKGTEIKNGSYLAEGSILTVNSTFTVEWADPADEGTGFSLNFMMNDAVYTAKMDENGMVWVGAEKLGWTSLAENGSLTLKDGTILSHTTRGEITVAQGYIKLADNGTNAKMVGGIEELDAYGNLTGFESGGAGINRIAANSVLAVESGIADLTKLEKGTVVGAKENTEIIRGSVVINTNKEELEIIANDVNASDAARKDAADRLANLNDVDVRIVGITFAANDKWNAEAEKDQNIGAGAYGHYLEANFDDMGVGLSNTFAFTQYHAGSSDIDNSFMGQVGANSGQILFVSMNDMRAKALGVDSIDISSRFGAAMAQTTIDNALQKVSHQRATLGAFQNRLEATIRNLDTTSENLQASESRVRDVDMAKEIIENTKQNILQQASQAMLAQANQAPQSVLQLLR
jgi:flagellin-like hook-associated protein FlgL